MSKKRNSGQDVVLFVMGLTIAIAVIIASMTSCKQVEYVTIPEVHEIHHHHTDSVHTTDSVTKEKETVIMQLDSAAMAQYGIQLKAAERAWLVKTAELERQIQQLSEIHTDTVHEIDSVPVPYPVEVVKEVEKELTWLQKALMTIGGAILLGFIGYILFKFVLKRFV